MYLNCSKKEANGLMTNEKIRNKIDELYKLIEEGIDPCSFVLNPQAREYAVEIQEIRQQCNHHFVDGQCQYCDEMEK